MSKPIPTTTSRDTSDLGAWARAMGMSLLEASADRVELCFDVAEEHLQPHGLVHGGVLSGAVETACSVGASVAAGGNRVVSGLENQTSFLRPVRAGRMRCIAVPIHTGRTTQLWQAEVQDEAGAAVAAGRLRLICLDAKGGAVGSSSEAVAKK